MEVGGFGYPALVAINGRKGAYSTLKGPFSKTGIKEFVRYVFKWPVLVENVDGCWQQYS